jgi:hypothetical protein
VFFSSELFCSIADSSGVLFPEVFCSGVLLAEILCSWVVYFTIVFFMEWIASYFLFLTDLKEIDE